ncbi:MAG TPA: TolC family protein [Bacteroidota bacterium]|nr:TolC family protein [Bacteroidota bacterium]
MKYAHLVLPVAIALCLTGSVGETLYAQQKLSLTIEQALSIGNENSKSLHMSSLKVQASDARLREANTAALPSVKVNGLYTRLSKVDPFDVGKSLNPLFVAIGVPNPSVPTDMIVDMYSARATVQQPLFTGYRISASKDIAEYSATAASQDYAKDKKELAYSIKSAYWSLYKAIEFKKVVDENVEQMRAHTKDAENLMAQGLATTNDVLKVQVQLSDAQVRQIDAANGVLLATIALNNTLGLPLSTEIALASPIDPTPRTINGDIDGLVKKAFAERPEIAAMNARLQAGEAGVTLARAGWYPQIALVGNYTYSNPNQRIFPQTKKFSDSWDVSLSVSFDVWNWGATAHQTDQAQSMLAQTYDAMGQLRDGITLEVTQNYLNQKQSIERISVARKGVQQAEENYRITDEKFKKGLSLNSDLLDAEVALLQARINYTQSLVDYELAEARLEKAIGE